MIVKKPFIMRSTSSITMQSLEKIVIRAPAVWVRKYGVCLSVTLWSAGALFVRRIIL